MRIIELEKQTALQDIIDAALTPIEKLMRCPKLNWKWRIDPEQRLSIKLADKLRWLEVQGRMKCCWTHIPNEGKRSQIVGAILKRMGMIPGAADFVFTGAFGGGYIELKIHPNGQNDNQRYFEMWCNQRNSKYVVHTAMEDTAEALDQCVNDAVKTLVEWGAVSG